jgi:FlaG/FlaF family flagellin (archaellin)
MVAIVVILAATISVFALGFTDEANQPGPIVGQSSGELVTQDGLDGGIVRITHIAGDPISVENIEIAVDARDACGKTARIVNLPSDSSNFGFNGFGDENLQNGGGSIISEGTFSSEWDIGVLHEANDNTFTAGTSFEFRLTGGTDPDDCTINSGDEVVVRVVHTPTNSVVIKETLTAT